MTIGQLLLCLGIASAVVIAFCAVAGLIIDRILPEVPDR